MAVPADKKPCIAVFASDAGPGDGERSSIMSQVGAHFARRGARLICLAERGALCVPLITSARSAGGEILVIADAGFALPSALATVPLERTANEEEGRLRVATLASVFVGLPGSLASSASLFNTWALAAEEGLQRPVFLLNRNRAFEVMRGFVADVVSHGMGNADRAVQFADSVEDLWARVSRAA